MGGNKQSACRSSHRKPNAFQEMGKFSYSGSHRRNPRSANTLSLKHFSAVWKTLPGREAALADQTMLIAFHNWTNARADEIIE
jgi:cytochrome c peroxidase